MQPESWLPCLGMYTVLRVSNRLFWARNVCNWLHGSSPCAINKECIVPFYVARQRCWADLWQDGQQNIICKVKRGIHFSSKVIWVVGLSLSKMMLTIGSEDLFVSMKLNMMFWIWMADPWFDTKYSLNGIVVRQETCSCGISKCHNLKSPKYFQTRDLVERKNWLKNR